MKYYSQYHSHKLFELQESLSGLSKSNRIVSIYQPHLCPIVRGKAKAKVEFGAKLDDTADTWIGACFFAKNVMKFLRGLLCLIFAKLGLKAFKRRISYSIDYLMGGLDPTRGCLVKII